MTIGLNKEELSKLATFGDSPEELQKSIFGEKSGKYMPTDEMIVCITASLIFNNIELILANNAKIAEQLKDAGIKLSD